MTLTEGRASARWLALVMTVITTLVTAACGSDPASGPLQALGGSQPVVDGMGIPVLAGQPADFTAFVYNPLHVPVTLVSASAVLVPGTLPAHLAHAAVDTTINIVGAARGWPPDIPVKPLDGAQVGHGQTNIIAGITGTTVDKNYAVAGLKITYQYQGHTYYVIAWSAAVACVKKAIVGRESECGKVVEPPIVAKVEKMAGAAG
jgi:hypothetical protein